MIVSLLSNDSESDIDESNIESRNIIIDSKITDEITTSYEFKLLSRFQGDDIIRPLREITTITVIKVKGTKEILGGW
ncbi:4462_t:CDS:2, partial [Funneliformis mosseae]